MGSVRLMFFPTASSQFKEIFYLHIFFSVTSRSLLSVTTTNDSTSCTPSAVENFPSKLMTSRQLKNGGLLVPVLIALYMFWGLAIVCDEYFVPVCEKISEGKVT